MTNNSKSTRRILIITGAIALLLGLASLLYFKQHISGQAPETNPRSRQELTNSDSNIATQTSPSFTLSNSPSDELLQRSIESAIASSGLGSGRWGIFAMSIRDGRVLYARDADKTFIPASNMKLYTTAVALDLLGADYRWRTSVFAATGQDKGGTIDGDLILYGRGAPDLGLDANGRRSALKQLADELYTRGVRRVRGNVIGDESYFRGGPLGDGWLWTDLQWYFGAEVSALSIAGNEISLIVTPAKKVSEPAELKLEPETDFVQAINETSTAEPNTPTTIGINRGLSNNSFRVWGDFPLKGSSFRARLAVHQPALWAARLFRNELRARGIIVDGDALMKSSLGKRDQERFNPLQSVELASLTSQTLREVSHATNKESLNLEAELILRTLGKEKGASVPDPDPRKMYMRGDDQAGIAVIKRWLEQAGISTKGISIHDGSGLSRLNLVTPEATARLLAAMWKAPAANAFRDTLPIAGRDGTLRGRMPGASARVFAKTGTMTYCNSLSGYALKADGDLIAFSIIYNDDSSASSSTAVLDKIALLFAGLR